MLQNKHVVVEELLEFLVAKIDTQLFKTIEVKYFEPGNIKNPNETYSAKCLLSRINESNISVTFFDITPITYTVR